MIMRNKLTVIAAVALAVASAAHAAPPDSADGYFVGNSLPTAAPRAFGPQTYTKEGLDLSRYGKLYIEELQFRYAAESGDIGISQSQMQRIARSARESLLQAVGTRFEVVDAPGPGVLHLRTAITDIRLEHKRRNLLSFTPVGLVKQGVEAATGHDTVLRAATVEAELLDSGSGERLMSVFDPGAGFAGGESTKASWKEVSRTLERLAQRLGSRAELSIAQSNLSQLAIARRK
jgi:hypothetical protein